MAVLPAGQRPVRALRSDAETNRLRLLAAARAVYAEQGLEASLNEIARRADVGIATLFRRYPTRSALTAAVLAETARDYAALAEVALEDPEPWHGFVGWLQGLFELQAADRSFVHVLTLSLPEAVETTALQRRTARAIPVLIRRAQATGRLRPEFVHQDVAMLLMALSGVLAATRDAAPDAWRRVAGVLIAGIGPGEDAVLPPAPSGAQVARSLSGTWPAGATGQTPAG